MERLNPEMKDNLLDTQVALRTQYESASELQKVMKQLDSQAMQWANNTRFTTTDVTEAISEASHAGWDLDKILEGIPAAMNISMAGSMSLSEGLNGLFSGGSLTEDDKRNFLDLGDQAAQAVLEGIQAGYREAKAGAEFFSGGETDGVWAGVLDTLEYGYSDAIQTAQSLSNQLREAMTSAFADGNLTSEEIDNIQSILQQQNELIAMAADAKNATEREKILRQAQTLGLDGLEEVSTLAENQRDAELQSLEDNYWDTYYQTKLSGELKIKNGAKKADGTLYSQADLDRELNALWEGDPDNPFDGYVGKRKEAEASYASFLLDLYSSTIAGSEYGNAWDAIVLVKVSIDEVGRGLRGLLGSAGFRKVIRGGAIMGGKNQDQDGKGGKG